MADYELQHVGVKGMKWGVRRYQNKDGSLTPEGRKRYGYGQAVDGIKSRVKSVVDKRKAKKAAEKAAEEEAKERNRPTRSLSDAELRAKINRLTLERQALDLERQIASLDPKTSSAGESFIKNFASKAITPAIMDAGKRVATDFLTKKGKDLLGLSDTDIDPYKELKKSVEGLNLQKQKRDLEKALRGESDPDEELAKTAKRMANEETISRLKKQREEREKAEREAQEKTERKTQTKKERDPNSNVIDGDDYVTVVDEPFGYLPSGKSKKRRKGRS